MSSAFSRGPARLSARAQSTWPCTGKRVLDLACRCKQLYVTEPTESRRAQRADHSTIRPRWELGDDVSTARRFNFPMLRRKAARCPGGLALVPAVSLYLGTACSWSVASGFQLPKDYPAPQARASSSPDPAESATSAALASAHLASASSWLRTDGKNTILGIWTASHAPHAAT